MLFEKKRGVPIPPKVRKSSKGYAAAVVSLLPGESVLLPCSRKTAYDVVHRLSYDRGVIDGEKYEVRAEGSGARVWRV